MKLQLRRLWLNTWESLQSTMRYKLPLCEKFKVNSWHSRNYLLR